MRMKRAKARSERNHPKTARVFSTAFPRALRTHKGKCFVPLEDYRALEKRYMALFKRYKRTLKQLDR